MSATPQPRKAWDAARILKLMLGAQCLLALMVVADGLPADLLRGLTGAGPRPPSVDVPVTPGNQTRRFEPNRLPSDQPAGPGFPTQEAVPSRLEFTENPPPGTSGAPAGDAVLMTGSIAPGDAERFGDWLAARATPPAAIALHSPGGAVDEALAIGRIIRDASLPVVVAPGASCFSACPYILAGGVERDVSRTARVGVHQHYFGENTYLPAFLLVSDIQAGQGEVMAYLDQMGIDPMVMTRALRTPPDDIYILLPEELQEFRLATTLSE